MSQSWILTDTQHRLWTESFGVSSDNFPPLAGKTGWSIQKFTLRGGLSDGVDVVEIHNGRMSLQILPTRGMGIWKGSCDGLSLGWNSPVHSPVHPQYVNALERGGIGWVYGFNEWLCRCGLAFNGPPGADDKGEVTLHGRIANLPAHFVQVSVSSEGPGVLSVMGIVDEAAIFSPSLRLVSTITMELGAASFHLKDEIHNLQSSPAEMELLYHINTGGPFLEAGTELVAPAREVSPRDPRAAEGIDCYSRYLGPTTGYAEQVYYYDLAAGADGQTQVLLKNSSGSCGLSLRYPRAQMPCFAQWKNTAALQDGYVTGLEPATNFPNFKKFERQQGRVLQIPVGGKYTCEMDVSVHSRPEDVARIEHSIRQLAPAAPQVHRTPQAHLSPAGK